MKTDLSYLKSMTDGNKNLIDEMIQIFSAQVVEFSEEMKDLILKKKWVELGRLAHKAKSSTAIMGMNELSEKLKELEMLASESRKTELYPSYIQSYINDCALAVEELRQYSADNR